MSIRVLALQKLRRQSPEIDQEDLTRDEVVVIREVERLAGFAPSVIRVTAFVCPSNLHSGITMPCGWEICERP
jgi:hypothetical protein